MARIQFTPALKRFFPGLKELEVNSDHIAAVIEEVEKHYPGIRDYLLDNNGSLRKHVNIFIGNSRIKDQRGLSDRVSAGDEIYIMQALSGG